MYVSKVRYTKGANSPVNVRLWGKLINIEKSPFGGFFFTLKEKAPAIAEAFIWLVFGNVMINLNGHVMAVVIGPALKFVNQRINIVIA